MIRAQPEPPVSKRTKAGPVNADRLKSFVERIEKLEEERKAIGGDIKDVYSEAKGVGYDVKTMKKVVRLRGMDAADRAEEESLLEVYLHALGMTMGNAVREVMAGAGVRATADKHRVSRSALSRSVPKSDDAPDLGTTAPDHDHTTGEIHADEGREEAGGDRGQDRGATVEPTQAEHGILAGRPEGADEGGAGSTEPRLVQPPVPDCHQGLEADPVETVKKVGAGDPRPEGTPSLYQRITGAFHDPRKDDDLTIPSFLDRRQRVPA